MKLHLGVLDIPYGNKPEETTGMVAEILEGKYSVMKTFFDMHDKEIVKDIEDSIAGALENVFAGKNKPNLLAEATGNIEKKFRDYLDKEEIAGKVSGVPTGAALKGITSRKQGKGLKMRKVKGKGKKFGIRRPSFIDSGIYRLTFKSWAEE